METITKTQKAIFGISALTFLALFVTLTTLNGWFFYDLGGQIPLGHAATMAVPFAAMGAAISFTAAILSISTGRLVVVVGFCFHLLSVGVTYSSMQFALDKQNLESGKSAATVELLEKQAAIKEEELRLAQSGALNKTQIQLQEEADRVLAKLKNTPARNSKGVKVGTVWEMTKACKAGNNYYINTYASVCDDIKNTAANYQRMVESAAEVGQRLSGHSEAIDKQMKAVSSQTASIKLPMIVQDETLNKQIVMMVVALLFDVALVMLEWLLSGKIGQKQPENDPANSVEFFRISAECKKVSADDEKSILDKVKTAKRAWGLFKAKNARMKRLEAEKSRAEKQAKTAQEQLSSMQTFEGLEAMRNMTGFHILRVFRDNNSVLDTETANVIALICRTYEIGGSLSRDKTHELVNSLPECADIKIGRDKLERAIKLMVGVLAEEYSRGSKQTAYRWANQGVIFGTIGSVKVA